MFKIILIFLRSLPELIYDYFKWMLRYSRHPERYPIEQRYRDVRRLVIHILRRFKLNIVAKNLEMVRNHEGKFLLLSNHLSAMDPLFLIALSETPIAFVSKKENKKTFLIGRVLSSIDSVFLDRKDLRQNAEALTKVNDDLKEGRLSYVIYPEGTRQKKVREDMNPLHPGSMKIGAKAGVDTILCATYGSFRPLSKHHYRNYLVQIEILDCVPPSAFIEQESSELIAHMTATMQSKINEQRDIDDAYHLEKHYKEKVKDSWESKYEIVIR